MDKNNPVVFDISSDEETALEEPIGNDYGWLSRLLADDSDEVVVVGEVKSKSSKAAANKEDDDDDDCVVLDGDPDKAVESVDDDEESEGDELLIVGQKGQIACRDFPHPRHHCAKFPFSSTEHKLHCSQCHCYVCDKLAPCEHWGTGLYNNDHCNATDKEASWKSQRDTALSTARPQPNEASTLDVIRLASNCTAQTQVCRPAVMRPYSSTRFGIPNIISHGRSRQPGSVHYRSRQPESASQQSQFLRAQSTVFRKDRHHVAGNVGMFKRPGVAGGAYTTNQPVNGSPNQGRASHVLQSGRIPVPQATSNDRIQIGSVPSMNKDSCTYQNTFETYATNVFASTVPSQPQVYNQPFPDPQAFSQIITQQPIYSQSIPEPQVYGQPVPEPQGYGEAVPEPQLYSQPFPEPQVLDQAISLPQAQTHAISQLNDGQNGSQLGNQRRGSCFPDFEEWVNNTNPQSNQQLPDENCQLNGTGSANELLPIKEFNLQCDGSDKFHCNDFEFQNWFPENDAEGYAPSSMVVVSPEPANFEAGMLLFDFDTSWNGLAQV